MRFTQITFRMKLTQFIVGLALCFAASAVTADDAAEPTHVRFASGDLTLGGELFLPAGEGPFPTVLFNHGSAPKLTNSFASAAIAPHFTGNGWAFFMPYRRGQGLSEDQGPYILDAVEAVRWTGFGKRASKLVELLTGDHLDDQLAALAWLRQQPFVDTNRIATVGNSFGGIQVMLGMEAANYCAGINAGGAAQSWDDAAELQRRLRQAAAAANGPVFFFQAENDYDTAPSKVLAAAMEQAGKAAQLTIYPAFGSGRHEGHSLPYRGVDIWIEDGLRFLNRHCPATAPGKADLGEN